MNSRNLLFTALEAGKSKIKALAPDEDLLAALSHGEGRKARDKEGTNLPFYNGNNLTLGGRDPNNSIPP
jgi:hypothetical protein